MRARKYFFVVNLCAVTCRHWILNLWINVCLVPCMHKILINHFWNGWIYRATHACSFFFRNKLLYRAMRAYNYNLQIYALCGTTMQSLIKICELMYDLHFACMCAITILKINECVLPFAHPISIIFSKISVCVVPCLHEILIKLLDECMCCALHAWNLIRRFQTNVCIVPCKHAIIFNHFLNECICCAMHALLGQTHVFNSNFSMNIWLAPCVHTILIKYSLNGCMCCVTHTFNCNS